ncbi:MAG: accessory factor UbiK family protein [Dongiaceae bacterium]
MQQDFRQDLGRLAAGLMSIALSLKEECRELGRRKAQSLAKKLDLVTREEFEVVKAMAEAARLNQVKTRGAVKSSSVKKKTLKK